MSSKGEHVSRLKILLTVGLVVAIAATSQADERSAVGASELPISSAGASGKLFPFFLPADDVTEGVTNLAFLNDKPADAPVYRAQGSLLRRWQTDPLLDRVDSGMLLLSHA